MNVPLPSKIIRHEINCIGVIRMGHKFRYNFIFLRIINSNLKMSDQLAESKGETKISYGDEDRSRGYGGGDDLEGKVFVGGLSWQTTLETLKYYFEKFGELSDAALMTDKRTGQPKGFGFVRFKDPAGIIYL